MLVDCKDIYTRFATYTVGQLSWPVCDSDNYKFWGKCLKRETVYQPEVPELMTEYVKCKKCYIVYAKNVVLGYSLYTTPSKVDKRIEGLGGLMPEDPIRNNFNLELIKSVYGKSSDFSLFDVGCSGGEFLELALGSGIKAEGIELNKEFAQEARKRTNAMIYEGDMCEISIARKFDVIQFTEILEHILEPNKFMNKVWEILNPGGMIFLTTMPNTSSIQIKSSKCENPMIRGTFSHHVLYNPSAIRFLLQEHGFSRIRFYHYKRNVWSIKDTLMRLINLFGYFDNQVIATAWK